MLLSDPVGKSYKIVAVRARGLDRSHYKQRRLAIWQMLSLGGASLLG